MTLKKLLYSSLVVVATGFTACSSATDETADTTNADTVSASPVNAYLNSSDPNAVQPTTQTSTQTGSASAQLNPAHGQPGHDCAVAVGAPLPNKSGGSVVTQPPATQPTIITNPTPQQPASSGAKLNPAHGQPGHDCAVAVGAPLGAAPSTSAPAQAAPVPTISTVPQPASLKTNTAGQKLNPAHGQPGHDCAVDVGAPLKN